jgi:hypothetical protein
MDTVRVEHSLELRAGDSETSLSVPVASLEEVLSAFATAHLRRFGFAAKGLRIMIDAVRVEARMSSIDASSLRVPEARVESALPTTARAWFGSWQEVPLLPSSSLAGVVKGQALIVEPNSTLVLDPASRCSCQDNAAACMREAIGKLRPGSFRYEMDSGQAIVVRIDIDQAVKRVHIDITGTSAQDPHNFNAPRAVCMAAVLYVFGTLIDRPIPLNEGCLEPLDITIPRGSMLDPVPPAAVAAGNVKTSRCIVDALYGALGMLAASQGTMNNLTFGDERVQY